MYLVNETSVEGYPLIPFTDEPRLHLEDIQEDWIFLQSKVPLRQMIADRRYTIYEFLQALHGKRLTTLYYRGILQVCWRRDLHEDLKSFLTYDPTMSIGTVQAITGEGIYIKRGNPISQCDVLFSDNIVDQLRVSMKYIRNAHGSGIDQIVGWVVDLPPSIQVEGGV